VTIGTGGGTCTIASGTHTITVFADDVNRIAESNKNNNMLSETITVP
jgi:subtilase family serine protease